ncbi:MAG: hypothetical protein KKH70_20470 [Gammaproteobacteria bacterium]|nr:hypothetical protein [Gammaproteobacteria bacterium]
MKLLKVLAILWKLGVFLYDQVDEDSEVKDEADFLMSLARYLIALVGKQYGPID